MQANKFKVLAVAAAVAMGLPMVANAESNIDATAPYSASARVDFSIVIPGLLSLRVGPAGTGISAISFAPDQAVVGNGTPVAGTGGDAGPGAVNVVVASTVGSVTLGATNPSLVNGSYSMAALAAIGVTSSAPTTLPHPAFGGTVAYPATSGFVFQSGTWTYSYLNTATPAAGTYGGQVTYTATAP